MITIALEQLITEIMNYESDTFSASGEELKPEEAEAIADKLVEGLLENIDGVKISSALDEIR